MTFAARSFAQRRFGFIAALALALVGQAASLAHLSLARHATCAEHGEWVDVDGGPRAASASTPRGTQAKLESLNVVAAAHAHDHCQIVAQQRARAFAQPEARTDTAPFAEPAAPLLVAATVVDVRRLLRNAPKHSPPTA